MTIEYRLDRKRELRENLERLADEEAELERVAKDLDICSKAQEAEVRLRTSLSLVEREDYQEAKEYTDTLRKQTKKTAQERKEKWGKRMKLAAKVVGVTAAVLSLGYGVYWTETTPRPRLHADRLHGMKEIFEQKLNEHLENSADLDCDNIPRVKEFYSFYKDATGKDFFQQSLDVNKRVFLGLSFDANIIIGTNNQYNYYKITLPRYLAEQLLQKKGNGNSCSITLE